MPKPASKAIVTITGDTLHFARPGVYTIEYLPSGNVKIKLDGQHAFVMKAEEYAAITNFTFADGAVLESVVQINGVTFHEADSTGPFEINQNLDVLLGELISNHGIAWTVDNLLINGSQADTFKVLWDYLDDAYVAGNNYYDLPLNETFVRLGVEYVDYIENGGEALTFVTAKYAADSNANDIPQREQSMHDNLLGNLATASLDDRFASDPVLLAELKALIPDEYEDRPWYSGNESDRGGPAHDAVRAFDYDKGWDRPDYVDADLDGLVDLLAQDGGEMFYGDGNTVDDWNLVRHEGAQVELALKVKHRQGDEYDEAYVDGDGVAHYVVESGPQDGNPARAEWNFDFAATDFSPDDDFTYTVELDLDPGEGEQWVTLFSSDAPGDTALGDGSTFQNSFNLAFVASAIDTDPDTPGIQPYAFGEGEFDIRISAYDATTDLLVMSHQVVVHVENVI